MTDFFISSAGECASYALIERRILVYMALLHPFEPQPCLKRHAGTVTGRRFSPAEHLAIQPPPDFLTRK